MGIRKGSIRSAWLVFTSVLWFGLGAGALATPVDTDSDGDGVPDVVDNCPTAFNPDQANSDGNALDGGDACDPCPASAVDDCDAVESGSAVVGPIGGVVTNANGLVSLDVPPGALPAAVTLSITNHPDVTSGLLMPGGAMAVRCSYTFTPEGVLFDAPATLTMHWLDADAVGVSEDAFDIYWYDPGPGRWVGQSANCDRVHNFCTIWTTHFSDYVLGYPQAPSAVGDQTPRITPAVFALRPGVPNPFNPSTTISFALPTTGPVNLAIFDLSGRRVRVLADGLLPAGEHEVRWNGTDDRGLQLASGVYLCRLTAGSFSGTTRMTMLE